MVNRTADEIVVKKYSNRRLYDTNDSRYVTLEELARRVRNGCQIRVYDAKSRQDITQDTLAQIVLEGRHGSRLLPVPLLLNLIRMNEQSFNEFFLHHLSSALQAFEANSSSSFQKSKRLRKWPEAGSDFMQRLFSSRSRPGGGSNAGKLFWFLQRSSTEETESHHSKEP